MRIRSIGYGAMVTEMMVALMAMIAACVLQRESISLLTQKARRRVVAKVSAAGFRSRSQNAEARNQP